MTVFTVFKIWIFASKRAISTDFLDRKVHRFIDNFA